LDWITGGAIVSLKVISHGECARLSAVPAPGCSRKLREFSAFLPGCSPRPALPSYELESGDALVRLKVELSAGIPRPERHIFY
jgi:hypothetical protein